MNQDQELKDLRNQIAGFKKDIDQKKLLVEIEVGLEISPLNQQIQKVYSPYQLQITNHSYYGAYSLTSKIPNLYLQSSFYYIYLKLFYQDQLNNLKDRNLFYKLIGKIVKTANISKYNLQNIYKQCHLLLFKTNQRDLKFCGDLILLMSQQKKEEGNQEEQLKKWQKYVKDKFHIDLSYLFFNQTYVQEEVGKAEHSIFFIFENNIQNDNTLFQQQLQQQIKFSVFISKSLLINQVLYKEINQMQNKQQGLISDKEKEQIKEETKQNQYFIQNSNDDDDYLFNNKFEYLKQNDQKSICSKCEENTLLTHYSEQRYCNSCLRKTIMYQ